MARTSAITTFQKGNGKNGSLEDVRRLCKQGRVSEALEILDATEELLDESAYGYLLQGCIHKKSLPEGKLVHAHITEKGFQANVFLGNTIVNMYAKCGILVDSRRAFDNMNERNVVSWTTLIAAYSRAGHDKEALEMFYEMQRTGIERNQFTFASVLPACSSLAAVKEIHGEIIRTEFESDVFVGCALVDMYAKYGSLEDARNVFDKMPQRDTVLWNAMIAGYAQNGHIEYALELFEKMPEQNVASWNAMILGYAQNGRVDEALKHFERIPERNVVSWTAMIAGFAQNGHGEQALNLFQQMLLAGVKPNSKTFAIILAACANLAALEQGREVHGDIIRSGFQSDMFAGSALADMYAKCGSLEVARQVFDKMSLKDVVAWNAMIAGYVQNGNMDEGMRLFWNMPQRDVISWNTMIAGYAQKGHIEEAFQLFQRMPQQDVVSFNSMITAYAQNEHIDEALKLFQKMPKRDVVSWNAMIAGYAQTGHVEEALELFQKMPERDVVSWNLMITGYARNGYVDEALKLSEKMPRRDVVSWNAIIAGCSQNGRIEEAFELFQKMPERDVVSWNAIIAGYAQNGHCEEALKLFQEMQVGNVVSNSDSFSLVLAACANLAALEQGKEAHEVVVRIGLHSNVSVGNALLGMYAKCGSIEDAHTAFDKMPERDLVSWTTMIVGYAMHGSGMEAIQLFERMQYSGLKPDGVSFIGVLSACCHSGLVDEGCQYFDRMSKYYQIIPTMEHYGCMVDLLGRAGTWMKAYNFIKKMPIEPDAAMWGSFLSACRIHTNIELGEFAAEQLFELDSKNPAPYVILSNLYATAGRWDGIEKVQNMMKGRMVKRQPGCSWIIINKKVYTFFPETCHNHRHTTFMQSCRDSGLFLKQDSC